ncbi:hypothetical protein ACH5RR_018341 [Cinchona calisaya]|uniref:Uncharacterized protein n=1 Tax=Cinchona calisaya TaxID=153742 RepID=A0ABD2ZP10_9GENT
MAGDSMVQTMHNPIRVSMMTSNEGIFDNSVQYDVPMQTIQVELNSMQVISNTPKKGVNEDEVLDPLSDLDEVSRFPQSRDRLMGILKAFLNSIKDKLGDSNVEIIASSSGLSGIRQAKAKKKAYPVMRTILTRHVVRVFKKLALSLLND